MQMCIQFQIENKSLMPNANGRIFFAEAIPNLSLFFLPKRNIETWIQWLADKSAINEIDEYPHKRRKESECKPQAEKLADMFIQNTDLSFALPSVQSAKKEYDRL